MGSKDSDILVRELNGKLEAAQPRAKIVKHTTTNIQNGKLEAAQARVKIVKRTTTNVQSTLESGGNTHAEQLLSSPVFVKNVICVFPQFLHRCADMHLAKLDISRNALHCLLL